MNTYEFRLDPAEDVPPTTVVIGPALYRFAARRADESRLAGEPSQDYLALRADEAGASFCICDGVSLSFFGGLAARLLGDALLEWCANGISTEAEEQEVRLSLARLLMELTHTAGEEVRNHPLPPMAAGLLREVLEDKRLLGSEAMFVCGRIDFRTRRFLRDGSCWGAWGISGYVSYLPMGGGSPRRQAVRRDKGGQRGGESLEAVRLCLSANCRLRQLV